MKKIILICAHPDDETLFFSSLLYSNSQDIHVICISDGNADGRGEERKREFETALDKFNITSFDFYSLPDQYNSPLNEDLLNEKIKISLRKFANEDTVLFTHGPFGEYGHPHHIQVGQLIHQNYLAKYTIYHPNILSIDEESLTFKENEIKMWELKLEIMCTIYKKEYQRFVTLIPAKAQEEFLKSGVETLEILNFLTGRTNHLDKNLGAYTPFHHSIKLFKEAGLTRKF